MAYKAALVAILAFLFLLVIPSTHAFADSITPKLYFKSGRLLDSWCSNATGFVIDSAWENELRYVLPRLKRRWARTGPRLFRAVYREFGKKFRRNEFTATYTLCTIPSMSSPLLLRVRWFLHNNGEAEVRPVYTFVDLVFHELLHTWLKNNFDFSESDLLLYFKQVEHEPQGVLSHLHLMSIQKFIYEQLGMTLYSDWIEDHYVSMGGDLARAWEIISENDRYLRFVDEVRDAD
jgi:hypothetical protein